MGRKCDFQGWVTKFNVRCSDGRTIKPTAFTEMNGKTVPLVYQHNHENIEDVLGHMLLENRDEGVWGYGYLNDSPKAAVARTAVSHKDITSFSIYANKLKQVGGDVVHGIIREVSLVLAGANPEAKIVEYDLAHMEDGEGEAVIYHGEEGILMEDNENLQHVDEEDNETVEDVLNTFNEKQKKVLYFLLGEALNGDYDEEVEQSDDEGEDVMKHNVFDNEEPKGEVLSHAEFTSMIEEAKNNKAMLSDIFKAHEVEVVSHAIDGQTDEITEEYGIHNLEYLFPEARTMDRYPQWIKKEDDWVAGWLGAVKKNPFSRIKMVYADITMDEARAKGYVKGTEKKEEVFKLLKRVIGPTTIYKKQKFDRDDLIDITDLDTISWIKTEMRMMLNGEIAVAELIGDGREADDDDKIDDTKIIPVIADDDFYTMKYTIDAADYTDDETNKLESVKLVDKMVEYLADYKGTGSPNLYTTKKLVNTLLLSRDMFGHRLWKTKAELATEIGVKNIIEVEHMEGRVDDDDNELWFVFVNPADYVTGADKGGAIAMFDDFDIDFNQYKYLMETRISGGLTKPKSAIVVYVTPVTEEAAGEP